jgi:Fe2+-dicitrate sensor, membrane component
MNEQLLIRFLTGACTQEEFHAIEKWISDDKTNAGWLFEMERIWSLKDELRFSDKKEIEAAYHRFTRKTGNNTSLQRDITRKLSYNWMKYTAVIVAVCLLSAYLHLVLRDTPGDSVANTIEVPVGQRASVILTDGTKVWLNAGSTLIYPAKFDKKSRTVELSGEGYFEVAADKRKPFMVHTSMLNVKVLGTKFNVKAYADENVSVALAEGKVQVSANDNRVSLTLQPNEKLSYLKNGQLVYDRSIDAEAISGWTSGELLFTDERLEDIVRTLERRFDVTIIIDTPELAGERFNCRTQPGVTVEQVLNLLKGTRKLNYTVENQTIKIKSRH